MRLIFQFCLIALLFVCFKAHSQTSVESESRPDEKPTQTLSKILINNREIFDQPERPIFKLVNLTHWVTRKEVIAREVWYQPGDTVTDEDLEELERNLRALNLFSEVTVSTQQSEEGAELVDLVIATQDKLSLLGVAGGTFLGGIGEVGFLLSESNLWGLGHQLRYRYVANSEQESLGTLSYENVYLGQKDIYAGLELGQTDDGDSATFRLENRFQNFDDSLSWKIEIKQETKKQDFFEEGESVAQVPREDRKLLLERTLHRGVRDASWKFGLHLSFEQAKFQDATGIQADMIDTPEDEDGMFGGFLVSHTKNLGNRKVIGLDTISFVQDLSLGYEVTVLAGVSRRDFETKSNTTPAVFLTVTNNNAISKFSYLNFKFDSLFGIDENSIDSWSTDSGFTWFNTRFKQQTLAARVKYTSASNNSGLPPQQLLGEDNGLRGYPAREFEGEQYLLVNLEHRRKGRLKFASMEFGSVFFFDAGWVGDRGDSTWLQNAQTSAGFGLRIGSPQLLGNAVIRIDYAYPLDDRNGKTFSPSFSIAIGQVFGFNP